MAPDWGSQNDLQIPKELTSGQPRLYGEEDKPKVAPKEKKKDVQVNALAGVTAPFDFISKYQLDPNKLPAPGMFFDLTPGKSAGALLDPETVKREFAVRYARQNPKLLAEDIQKGTNKFNSLVSDKVDDFLRSVTSKTTDGRYDEYKATRQDPRTGRPVGNPNAILSPQESAVLDALIKKNGSNANFGDFFALFKNNSGGVAQTFVDMNRRNNANKISGLEEFVSRIKSFEHEPSGNNKLGVLVEHNDVPDQAQINQLLANQHEYNNQYNKYSEDYDKAHALWQLKYGNQDPDAVNQANKQNTERRISTFKTAEAEIAGMRENNPMVGVAYNPANPNMISRGIGWSFLDPYQEIKPAPEFNGPQPPTAPDLTPMSTKRVKIEAESKPKPAKASTQPKNQLREVIYATPSGVTLWGTQSDPVKTIISEAAQIPDVQIGAVLSRFKDGAANILNAESAWSGFGTPNNNTAGKTIVGSIKDYAWNKLKSVAQSGKQNGRSYDYSSPPTPGGGTNAGLNAVAEVIIQGLLTKDPKLKQYGEDVASAFGIKLDGVRNALLANEAYIDWNPNGWFKPGRSFVQNIGPDAKEIYAGGTGKADPILFNSTKSSSLLAPPSSSIVSTQANTWFSKANQVGLALAQHIYGPLLAAYERDTKRAIPSFTSSTSTSASGGYQFDRNTIAETLGKNTGIYLFSTLKW